MKPKNMDLPHEGTYIRLKPSKVHRGGIGVFAIKKIDKDTDIFSGKYDKIQWLNVNKLRLGSLPKEIQKLYDDFCIIKNNNTEYGCPKSFNQLTPCWYLNSSKHPNVRCDEKSGYKFYALRNIKKGEELTVDYSTYSEF